MRRYLSVHKQLQQQHTQADTHMRARVERVKTFYLAVKTGWLRHKRSIVNDTLPLKNKIHVLSKTA